ncbi:hypothetical protein Mapa_011388 [Marchantia paleacea]|nr:hypothetical protein Mapa_011388 [Marchantia paleacea]
MARVLSFLSAAALISVFVVSHYIPLATAVENLKQEFEVVITTGKNQTGSVSGASLAIQSEVAGTVLTLDTVASKIAANKATTFRTSSLGISGDICFLQLQYTGGSAPEWYVGTITVTVVESKKTVTFEANKSVAITEALTIDTCKQRQES